MTALVLLVGREAQVESTTSALVRRLILEREFDFVDWTLDAAQVKTAQSWLNDQAYLSADESKQFILDYLGLLEQIQRLEARINQIYTDPNETDPEAGGLPLRTELEELRVRQSQRQPLAEEIFQNQVTTSLAGLGLTLGGQPIPPVSFHTTPLPMALIVSPRDMIRQEANLEINPGLTADGQSALEDEIDRALAVSSLVAPLGGIGTYPTMILETTSLPWLAEVTAHEWVHNFLSLRPLGISYLSTPELRTMNETAASLAGKEIGEALIARFYPELIPAPPSPAQLEGPEDSPPAPPAFDFRAEMRATRVRTDELLALGKIDEAELYMELRRRVFVEQGYSIRKLNQAYFAFYGAYADEPGAPGADPVGPAVVELRQRSPSLAAFLKRISWYTNFEQLHRALEE